MTWTIRDERFDKNRITGNGNKCIIGNGYMGYRGTLEEFGKNELVACNLAGLYDRFGSSWREPINAPNGFFTSLAVNGTEIGALQQEPAEHAQILEINHGLHIRDTVWDTGSGKIHIRAERFASLADVHLMCLKYTVSVDQSCELRIKTGIDGEVWDINGPHLEVYVPEAGADTAEAGACTPEAEAYATEAGAYTPVAGAGATEAGAYTSEAGAGITAVGSGYIRILARTQELKIPVAVAEACKYSFDADEAVEKRDKCIFRIIKINAQPQTEYTIFKYISVYTGNDGVPDIPGVSAAAVLKAASAGYEEVFSRHAAQWRSRWEDSDVVIDGDENDQLALRYSIYHLQIIAPVHAQDQSIPARGLSGQTYKGAIFWDTEMFMLPFFLHTAPEVAKSLVKYRIKALEGARRKAADYGFKGAFYAWESQEFGEDACSDFNVTDAFTGRPVKTYFRDKQVHISADVAYAIWEVYSFTGNADILLKGGAEVILECARFYYSYVYYKEDKDRYEILDVIGPDEYHERVNNNAFTNKMVCHTLDIALKSLDLLKNDYPQEYAELISRLDYGEDVAKISKLREKLYVVQPDPDTLLIEQFDGYDRLEDCSLAEVKSRLLDPKEYWGGGHGVASTTKIIKQADVVLMLHLFGNEYSREVKKANWSYYEPRTEHGSSLSPCIYSLLSCDIGNAEWAYPFFVKTANIDLTGESKQYAGLIYIGGTHPAANGGAWMAAVLGFGGLKVENGAVTVRPNLPEKWKRLSFRVIIRGEKYAIEITKDNHSISKIQ